MGAEKIEKYFFGESNFSIFNLDEDDLYFYIFPSFILPQRMLDLRKKIMSDTIFLGPKFTLLIFEPNFLIHNYMDSKTFWIENVCSIKDILQNVFGFKFQDPTIFGFTLLFVS